MKAKKNKNAKRCQIWHLFVNYITKGIILYFIYLTEYSHPVWTTDVFSVAVLCQNRLDHVGTGEKIGEKFIHYAGNTLKDIPVGDPLVVKGSGTGNGEVIAFVAVPLRFCPFGTEAETLQG